VPISEVTRRALEEVRRGEVRAALSETQETLSWLPSAEIAEAIRASRERRGRS